MYKESKKTDVLLASKRRIQKSLNLDNYCVELRGATFFLTHLEYIQSIDICDTILTFPPRHKVDRYDEYSKIIYMKVYQKLCEVKTTEQIENIMTDILSMFTSSVYLKSLPENYDITHKKPGRVFRNLTNIVFHGLYMDVTAEK